MPALHHRSRLANALAGAAALVLGTPGLTVRADVDPAVLQAESARVEVIRAASRCAVSIFAGDAGGGSGVLVSPDGYALTNFHVVESAGPALRCGLDDGRLYDAVLVGLDPTGDVAMIRLLGRDDFPHATPADSDAVQPGDFCFAASRACGGRLPQPSPSPTSRACTSPLPCPPAMWLSFMGVAAPPCPPAAPPPAPAVPAAPCCC
ncbi:MAG: S1C family serine protease [Planctomycetaceae bacterium]